MIITIGMSLRHSWCTNVFYFLSCFTLTLEVQLFTQGRSRQQTLGNTTNLKLMIANAREHCPSIQAITTTDQLVLH